MKPSPLPIVILVVVVAAILWWFWPRDKPVQAGSESAKQLASAPAQPPKSEPSPPAVAASGSDAGGSSAAAGSAASTTTGASTSAAAAAPGGSPSAGSTSSSASGPASSASAGSPSGASGASTASLPTSASAAAGAPANAGSGSAAARAASAPKTAEPLNVVVYFDFDRSALGAGETPKLDAFLAKLKDRKYTRLNAVGHADRIGEAPHNDQLSKKRADAVVAYLASKGADAARNHTDAKGEKQPATGDACKDLGPESASNTKLVDCLAKDRRVEVALAD